MFFSIHQQMCMAMEDLGAHLYAYRKRRSGRDYLSALVNYGGSSAYLYELFDGKSREQIAAEFGFENEISETLRKGGYDEGEVEAFLYVIATCSHQLKEIIFQYMVLYHPMFAEKALTSEVVAPRVDADDLPQTIEPNGADGRI